MAASPRNGRRMDAARDEADMRRVDYFDKLDN
jgi:hypothetical protein